jgi:chain length determinant protein tyrosine kinase EpsG
MSESDLTQPTPVRLSRLGELLLSKNQLNLHQIELIAKEQDARGFRFGDAAVALGFLSQAQLDAALDQQFGYDNNAVLVGKVDPVLTILHEPFSHAAEQIRRLRSELVLRFEENACVKLVVISPDRGEGKSYIAASLAISLAQLGKRTLLVDADLRTSSQHTLFGLGRRDGLSSVLAKRLPLEQAVIQVMPKLQILPAGPPPPNPLEILRAPHLDNLLDGYANQFDACIVDSYSAGLASDAQMVANQIGCVVVVALQDQTSMSALRLTLDDMRAADVEVLGCILNRGGDGSTTPTVVAGKSGIKNAIKRGWW